MVRSSSMLAVNSNTATHQLQKPSSASRLANRYDIRDEIIAHGSTSVVSMAEDVQAGVKYVFRSQPTTAT
jgi:hypothetical protein